MLRCYVCNGELVELTEIELLDEDVIIYQCNACGNEQFERYE